MQAFDGCSPFLLAFPFDDEGQLPTSDSTAKEEKIDPDDCNPTVPGLSASPLAIDSIWRNLRQQVFQSNTQFGFFFRALTKIPAGLMTRLLPLQFSLCLCRTAKSLGVVGTM